MDVSESTEVEENRMLRPRAPKQKTIPPIIFKEPKRRGKAEYHREYRSKRKNRKEDYEAFREVENMRIKDYRGRQSEDAKQRARELQRERQRRYRQRKKEQGKEDRRHRTRKSTERQRKSWKDTKKTWRETLSDQKKRAINQKKRDKYHAKKLQKTVAATMNNHEVSPTPSPAPTRSSKCRYKKKLLKSLPSSRSLKAEVIHASIQQQTPTSRKVIHHRLGMLSPDCRKKLSVADSIATTMATLRKTRNKRHMRNKRLIAHAVLVKKQSMKILRSIGISRKIKRRLKSGSQQPGWEEHRAQRSDALAHEQIKTIQEFYSHGNISADIPNIRSGLKKDGSIVGRRVMSISLLCAYQQFREASPSVKVSFSKFKKLRPSTVLPHTQNRFRECLCEYCVNIELKLKAVNKLVCANGKADLQINNKYEASKMTLCPTSASENRKKTCLDRECHACGTRQVISHLQSVLTDASENKIEWQRWEKGTHDGQFWRTMKVTKDGTVQKLVEELVKELGPFSVHLFNAKWQHDQFRSVTSNPPEETVIVCLDYGENYTCQAQDAPQGYHWTNTRVTIHPVVATYSCPHPDCGKQVTDSIVYLSDDMKHDQHGVQHFVRKSVDILKEDGIKFSQLLQYSDGSPTQYKSKTNFVDCSFSNSDMNVVSEKHYFGSRHGKGPCDREIGVIKKSVKMAVAASQVTVCTPQQFFNVCKQRLTLPRQEDDHIHTKRRFVFVSKDEVDRDRPERSAVKPMKDTRKMHSVRGICPYTIKARERSCFCTACREGEQCLHEEITGKWKSVKLVQVKRASMTNDVNIDDTEGTTGEHSNDAQIEPEATPEAEPADQESLKYGDYVEVDLSSGSPQPKMFIGLIETVDEQAAEVEVSFMRSKNRFYVWPDMADRSWVPFDVVVRKLQPPSINSRGHHIFAACTQQP